MTPTENGKVARNRTTRAEQLVAAEVRKRDSETDRSETLKLSIINAGASDTVIDSS